MKRIAAEVADRSQISAFIGTHKSMSRIFHDQDTSVFCKTHYFLHITGHAGIVHDDNDFCFHRQRLFNRICIAVHRFRTDIHKDQFRSHTRKRYCCA